MDCIHHKLAGMIILQPVKNLRALLPRRDHATQPHLGQMLGNGGSRLPYPLSQGVDRQLTLPQGKDQPDPRGIGQHGKHLDGELNMRTVDLNLHICIHMQIVSPMPPPRNFSVARRNTAPEAVVEDR